MIYRPITCVWEVTMGCNMRCGHCGSSCTTPLFDELNTDEALDICEQIAQLGVRWVTLSGGEPLLRRDIAQLVQCLSGSGVAVNIISNGWMMSSDMAVKLKESGLSTLAVSVDGPRDLHDRIRRVGAYEHAGNAIRAAKECGICVGAVTTLSKENIDCLNELKEELIGMGVDSWQVQLGLPMGSMGQDHADWVLDPCQMQDIIEFCYHTAKEGRIKIYPADSIGYYSEMEMEIKRISFHVDDPPAWNGCNAGLRSFGILQNGDVTGCTSIRNREFVEGNIRERSLQDIWEDEDSFSWRRNMTADSLGPKCRSCGYAEKCLGGCTNTRLTMEGDIYSDNRYCVYSIYRDRLEAGGNSADSSEM